VERFDGHTARFGSPAPQTDLPSSASAFRRVVRFDRHAARFDSVALD
jgi:hypothetical protein